MSGGSPFLRWQGSTPLAGRRMEMAVLRERLRAAMTGDPKIVEITGVAGIGKSRILREIVGEAAETGITTARAVCRPSQTPLGVLADVLRQLGEHASVVNKPVVAALDAIEALAPTDGSSAPERRADHVSIAFIDAITEVALERPLLVCIEDLHEIDAASAEVLVGLGDSLDMSPANPHLCLLLTRRPIENSNVFAPAAARLERLPHFDALTLSELNEVEVNELLYLLGSAAPAPALLHAVQRTTHGNPLFIKTAYGQLAGSGLLELVGNEVRAVGEGNPELPSDLESAISSSVSGLSDHARALLQIGAIAGGPLDIEMLVALTGVEVDEVVDRLDEAILSGAARMSDGAIRFEHPLFATAFYLDVPPLRRQRLHLRIAEHMMNDGQYQPAEIADQLMAAGTLSPVPSVVRWTRAAGDHASAVGAWSAAARYYDAAVDYGASLGLDDVEVLGLRLRSGLSHARNMDTSGAEKSLVPAIDLARKVGDEHAWGEAVLTLVRARFGHGGEKVGVFNDTSALTDFLDGVGDRQPLLRARALEQLAEIHFEAFDAEGGMTHIQKAKAILGDHPDHLVSRAVQFGAGLLHLGRLELDEARASFERSIAHGQALDDEWYQVWGAGRLPPVHLAAGDLEGARTAGEHSAALAGQVRFWSELAFTRANQSAVMLASGDLEAALHFADEAERIDRRGDHAYTGILLYAVKSSTLALAGRTGEALEVIDAWRASGALGWELHHLLILATTGDRQALEAGLVEFAPFTKWPGVADWMFYNWAVCLAECGSAVVNTDLLNEARGPLQHYFDRGLRVGPSWSALTERLLGNVAYGLGELDVAEKHLSSAMAFATRIGAHTELARTKIDLARTRFAAGERRDATALLDQAVEDATNRGLHAVVAQAHAVGASAGQVVSDGEERTLLVNDLVSSTALTVAVGDAGFFEIFSDLEATVRGLGRVHRGTLFRDTGDGFCMWFRSPSDAVDFAIAFNRDLRRRGQDRPEMVQMRTGLHTGHPLVVGTDQRGLAIVTATRVCEAASAEQILVSDATRSRLDPNTYSIVSAGEYEMKGLTSPAELFEVR